MSVFYVTGSSGFIGSAICNYLEAKGETIIRHDRRDDILMNVINANVFINCQAYGNHASQKDIKKIIIANIQNLSWYLDSCSRSNNHKFYNLSTSSVHLKVQTAYSLSKQLGEMLVTEAGGINIRPYSVFGPGEAAHRFIPTVIRCLETGEKMQLATEPKHDWIGVNDFIEAMFADPLQGDKEIGTGESYSNLEIVRMLEDISGKQLNFDIVEGLRSYDNTDWKCPKGVPHLPIKEALKLTYEQITRKNN